MKFGIKRLGAGGANGRRYHLFDEEGRIKLVADHGSPWLVAKSNHHVRFARPSGDVVALMGLPRQLLPSYNRQQPVSYAIILNHAVYAIINEFHNLPETKGAQVTHLTIEVEGMRWLALEQSEGDLYFCLYDEASADSAIYDEPLEAPLAEAVCRICRSTGEYDFTVEMAAGRLARTSVVLLALVFLIDRPVEAGMRN